MRSSIRGPPRRSAREVGWGTAKGLKTIHAQMGVMQNASKWRGSVQKSNQLRGSLKKGNFVEGTKKKRTHKEPRGH